MDRSVLLNKIRHLLNKTVANGATEAEAATALKHAERMMAEHDIAIAEAMESGERLEFASEIAREFGPKTPAFLPDVNRVVEEIFGVECLIRDTRFRYSNKLANVRVAIFGEASKIVAACWAFNFLCNTFRRFWNAYRIANRNKIGFHPSLAGGYYAGLADGFLAKVREGQVRETSNALVKLDAAQKAAFAEAFPGVSMAITKYRCSAAVYGAGVQDGRTINLARPIQQGSPRALESGRS